MVEMAVEQNKIKYLNKTIKINQHTNQRFIGN